MSENERWRSLQIFVVLCGRNVADTEIIVLVARLWIDQPNAHQLFGMGKGESAQHDRVDHSELSGRAANAEREHKHGQENKTSLSLNKTRSPTRTSWRNESRIITNFPC